VQTEEVEQSIGLAAARAEMYVGNEKRAKPSRVRHNAASFLPLIMGKRIANSRLAFMTAPLNIWRVSCWGALRFAAPEPHQRIDAEGPHLAPFDQLGTAMAGGWANELPVRSADEYCGSLPTTARAQGLSNDHEALTAQGKSAAVACRGVGISQQN
jgi:hypothetical protein